MVMLHKMLIGVLAMSLIITGVVIYLNGGNNEYSPSGFDSSAFEKFNNSFNNIIEITNETKTSLDSASSEPDLLDVFGNLFNQIWGSVKITAQSITTFGDVTDEAVDNVKGIGEYGSIVKVILGGMILVVIVVGIVMHFVSKSERN